MPLKRTEPFSIAQATPYNRHCQSRLLFIPGVLGNLYSRDYGRLLLGSGRRSRAAKSGGVGAESAKTRFA